MSAAADHIREQQRNTWDQFSAGWRKWDAEMLRWHAPFGDALIKEAMLRPDSMVLDVAAGTGEPGLTAAGLVPQGSVTLADISAGMLLVADEKAKAKGLDNVRTVVSDAVALPFDEGTFDAVLCRFGFMYFPDMAAAAAEMARVARPGARVSAAVWSRAAENPWATLVLGTIARNTELPSVPGAPGPFRCAAPGCMRRLFQDAGLTDVTERKVSTELVRGSPERYWEFMTDIAASVTVGLAEADQEARELIRAEVFELLRRYEHDGALRLRSTATIVAGTRPAG